MAAGAGYGSIESKKAPTLSTYTAGEDAGRLAGKSALVMFDHVNSSVQYEVSIISLLHMNLICLY